MAPHIATNTAVELDELLAFVRPRHRAILLTTRSDGRPQGAGFGRAARRVLPEHLG